MLNRVHKVARRRSQELPRESLLPFRGSRLSALLLLLLLLFIHSSSLYGYLPYKGPDP